METIYRDIRDIQHKDKSSNRKGEIVRSKLKEKGLKQQVGHDAKHD